LKATADYADEPDRFWERTRLACWQRRPFPGFVDNATLVEFVADKARQALDDFMTWETAPPSG
jgi:hypothetical protein